MGEGGNGGLRVRFDARVRPEFQGAKVTSDAGGRCCARSLWDHHLLPLGKISRPLSRPRQETSPETEESPLQGTKSWFIWRIPIDMDDPR